MVLLLLLASHHCPESLTQGHGQLRLLGWWMLQLSMDPAMIWRLPGSIDPPGTKASTNSQLLNKELLAWGVVNNHLVQMVRYG